MHLLPPIPGLRHPSCGYGCAVVLDPLFINPVFRPATPKPTAESPRHIFRGYWALQVVGENWRRRLWRSLDGRAARTGQTPSCPQAHQAGHGFQTSRRPFRGRATGPRDDGSSEDCEDSRCGYNGESQKEEGTRKNEESSSLDGERREHLAGGSRHVRRMAGPSAIWVGCVRARREGLRRTRPGSPQSRLAPCRL